MGIIPTEFQIFYIFNPVMGSKPGQGLLSKYF